MKRIIERQNQQLARGARGIVGNHVLIQHGQEYSLYAHLQPGSVKVKTYETVTRSADRAGRQLGELHGAAPALHVCDGPTCRCAPASRCGSRTWRSTAPCSRDSCRAATW